MPTSSTAHVGPVDRQDVPEDLHPRPPRAPLERQEEPFPRAEPHPARAVVERRGDPVPARRAGRSPRGSRRRIGYGRPQPGQTGLGPRSRAPTVQAAGEVGERGVGSRGGVAGVMTILGR